MEIGKLVNLVRGRNIALIQNKERVKERDQIDLIEEGGNVFLLISDYSTDNNIIFAVHLKKKLHGIT